MDMTKEETWYLHTTMSDPLTRYYVFTNTNGEKFIIEEITLLQLLKERSPIAVYFGNYCARCYWQHLLDMHSIQDNKDEPDHA
jgi:hypothetical protein